MRDAHHELPRAIGPDAPTTSVAVTTTASPAQLWPLLTDPTTPAPFSAELEGAHWMMQRTVDGIAAIAEGRTPVPGE